MVYNKIYAQLGEERHIVLDPVNYQYDVKQILVLTGENVPDYYEADICNVGDTATLTMVGTAADGAEIPDKFFRDGRNVLVYVVIPGSGGDVQTRYDITIPSDERGEREDIELDTDQQTQADSLIAALNSGVGRAEAAAEAIQDMDVEAETLAAGSAASVEKTVDPETGAVTLNFGIPQGQKGNPGTPGQDGTTPDFRIGTVETLNPGQSATATITGTPAQPVLNLGIPQGQKGDPGGDSGTSDYTELENKPQINGHTLTGNQSASDLGLGTYSKPADGIPKTDLAQDVQQSLRKADTALQTAPVQSVAGKTGAVNLGAGDVGFNSSEEYNEGTVGAKLSTLNRHLSDKQDKPATAGTAGQVLGLDSNLDPVWVNNGGGSGGAVDDVQINGTSIVSSGVANIPVGDNIKQGVTRGRTDRGISLASGWAQIVPATSNVIKSSANSYLPVVPSYQHEAAFYGLAKAAGDTTQSRSSNPVGTYTEEAKTAIKSMLGVAGGGGMNIVNLSGTQITQVGTDNTFYVCGELTELTFTAPSVGITMIRFTSGTTPTVLTVNGVTSWMFDNDPTAASLEANKTYDINVLNGVGVVGWA